MPRLGCGWSELGFKGFDLSTLSQSDGHGRNGEKKKEKKQYWKHRPQTHHHDHRPLHHTTTNTTTTTTTTTTSATRPRPRPRPPPALQPVSASYRNHRRRLPHYVLEKNAKSMAEPIVSYVSPVLHGVPILMICGTNNAKKLDVFCAAGVVDLERAVQQQDVIMVWAWMHWPMDALVAWTLSWFGHGCTGQWMPR